MFKPTQADEDLQLELEQQQGEEQPPELPVPTGIELTEFNEDFRNSPYAYLDELRTREPVHRDVVLNRVLLTRHNDVSDVLCNDNLWRDPRKANPDSFIRTGFDPEHKPSLLCMDDPDHARLRGLVSQVYATDTIEAYRPRIRAIITEILDELDEHEFEFDVISKYTARIPPLVSADLLGIDPARQSQFRAWSELTVGAFFNTAPNADEVLAAAAARSELDALFSGVIAARRNAPTHCLIDALLRAEHAGARLRDDEIVQQCHLLLIGNAATAALLGNGIKAFLCNTRQMNRIRQQPELIGNAIEEVLRFDPPVVSCVRIANEDMVIGGCPVAKGESLSVSLAAANRDPDIYSDPDKFDVHRVAIQHQAFGGGHHACLGAQLARIQAQEAICGLIMRFEDLETSPQGWGFATLKNLRSLTHFWVRS